MQIAEMSNVMVRRRHIIWSQLHSERLQEIQKGCHSELFLSLLPFFCSNKSSEMVRCARYCQIKYFSDIILDDFSTLNIFCQWTSYLWLFNDEHYIDFSRICVKNSQPNFGWLKHGIVCAFQWMKYCVKRWCTCGLPIFDVSSNSMCPRRFVFTFTWYSSFNKWFSALHSSNGWDNCTCRMTAKWFSFFSLTRKHNLNSSLSKIYWSKLDSARSFYYVSEI